MEYYVIAGFPGVGKTYAYNALQLYLEKYNERASHPNFPFRKLKWKVFDTDSSEFSHMEDPVTKLKAINPDFPRNYVGAIKERIRDCEGDGYDKCIIFVSSHDVVRTALDEAGIESILVYPKVGAKDIYLQRYRQRMSPEPLIKKIDENYIDWIREIEKEQKYHCKKFQLEDDEYMWSVLSYIMSNPGVKYTSYF